ncbi:MAG: histidine kinase, partial [Oscillospiraceae bacterium]
GKYETVDALYYQLITRSLVANDAVNISVLDKFNTQYSSGSLTENFTEKEKSDISELLRSTTRSSPPVWYLRESSREMVYLRYIYASPYGEQNPAGILTISTDMRKLLVQNTDGSLKNGNLAIAYNGNILYLHNENAKNSDDFINLIKSGNGSASNTFFLKKASAFDKVEYFGYEKLHNILPAVNPAMLTAILLIILICAVTFGSTARLVHSITAPIEYLSNKMGKVEKGNFKTKINVDKFDTDTEEIYDLALRFNLMTTQIEQLVQNNYMRQIREKEYQLKALQAQINPHFLYNTLDSINWLAVGAQQPEISGMVQSLANLFREATDQEHFIIPLRQELRLLASYLTIQKIRLEDRLVIRVDVTPECMEWEIPKLSLQPIVENSIKAGAERSMKACNIIVKARIIHNRLVVSIYDNGCGISK